MAAVFGARSFGLKAHILSRQSSRLFPVAQLRLMSNKTSGSKETTSAPVKEDPTSYHVPEYYSHDKDTFADFEVEMAGYRQSQPDPRVPYYHHCPWEKK